MKQNKLSEQTAVNLGFGGLFNGFGEMMGESEEEFNKRGVKNDKEFNFTLDTAYASDTGYFETAIITDKYNDGNWVILDECKTRKQAVKMHTKWLKFFKKGFPETIKDIHLDESFDLLT